MDRKLGQVRGDLFTGSVTFTINFITTDKQNICFCSYDNRNLLYIQMKEAVQNFQALIRE